MHTIFRTTVAAFVLALLAGLTVPVHAQGVKIGVFDPTRVSEEVADAQQLQVSLIQMREEKQAAIAVKEQIVNDLRQKLQQRPCPCHRTSERRWKSTSSATSSR